VIVTPKLELVGRIEMALGDIKFDFPGDQYIR
jgi:hypothetical protein